VKFYMKAPAFQFYPADFLVGTAHFTAEQVGVYIRLLCYQWENGYIENSDRMMGQLGGCSEMTARTMREKFKMTTDGFGLQNKRLEEVRKKQQEYHKKQSENANSRWKHTNKNATAYAAHMPSGMPKACSPTPTPSPTPNNTLIHGGKPPAERNVLLDAIASIGGGNPLATPKSRWSGLAKVLADIKSATPDLTVDEIRRREHHYELLYPTIRPTPEALAKWWAVCDKRPATLNQNAAPTESDHSRGF
jgi:uncharacterized protein YdaU (DUF1376 family)